MGHFEAEIVEERNSKAKFHIIHAYFSKTNEFKIKKYDATVSLMLRRGEAQMRQKIRENIFIPGHVYKEEPCCHFAITMS